MLMFVDFSNLVVPPLSAAASPRASMPRRFDYLTHLVKWIEDKKYEQSVVGRYVGGLYIAQ